MHRLVKGIHDFKKNVFTEKEQLFRSLENGQRPGTLFFTCSDSRIDPCLLTQSEPGDLFIVRNAGNLIPASPHEGGEIATIEYAVVALEIPEIVVCGHSDCGAMKGLMNVAALTPTMPRVSKWLGHAQKTADAVKARCCHLSGRELVDKTVEENVIVQLDNLMSHSFIRERVLAGRLQLHGWVYKFETGDVLQYDVQTRKFLPLLSGPGGHHPTSHRSESMIEIEEAL